MFRVERVAGGTERDKKEVLETLAERFESQDHKELEGIAIEKNPEIIKAISVADRATSAVLEKYGIDAGSIDANKVHVIKRDAWPSDDAAQFIFSHQCVLIPESENYMKQAYRLSHELFHFKSYQAGQILPDERMDYRVGLTVKTRDGGQTHLTPLNEAVTETLTIEAFRSDVFQTEYAEEIKKSQAIMQQNPEAQNEDGQPLFTDQTFFAELGPELDDGSHDIFTSQFTYQSEREAYQLLVTALYEKNHEKFESMEEVMRLFVTSTFNGDLIKIGKLIDKSFGKGSFRQLAGIQDGEEFLMTVKKMVASGNNLI